jgi:hypothetical protein
MRHTRHPSPHGGADRRALLLGLAATALAGPALAQGASFSRVSVDVDPLRRLGLGTYAAFVGASLTQELRRAFAGRLGVRGAPDLVVRISSVQLSSFAGDGGGGRWFSGGGSSDYMDGEALIVRGREVLKRHPQLSALPSSYAGPWYQPDGERKRTAALCEHYASWLARAL